MKNEKTIIIDYGMGNFGSVFNMLKKIGANAIISSNPIDINNADKLILSGVGAFDNGMKNIIDLGLKDSINDRVINYKVPILGICLGMQLLTLKSEEGKLPGLGWLDADTIRFKFNGESNNKLKIPHMGWNTVNVIKESKLFINMYDEARFYFVHSYHLICRQKKDALCATDYGYEFISAIEKENIYGVQFHPEKSHKFGMKLLQNFMEL